MPSAERALCDTGPLVALFSTGQYARAECEQALTHLQGTLVTTFPVLTESFYFLDRPSEQRLLWDFVMSGAVRVAEVGLIAVVRMRRLMEKYSDLPMDFADASLVAVGEELNLRKVFTLDHHFRIYRPRHTPAFELFP